ncbi:BREX-1 system adenine-specific DNA-methyltransferase PglX [Mesorhizobium sp.]|uniref:BREX-1 system adenine-specific DNA-methyltransferase PglX n=1 Tax=Mesorhizobium sp. TaxID=1871066 RepID=UPI000FE645E2|nr:BREX-1 system adenine-specific DNA-methyltransferase PglX [Mesorhizobium sp.]RWO20269.1 MAG: BREX-1 system adenine-specific DNA-methyltransferase PglX [Mesorhizobium sp.]
MDTSKLKKFAQFARRSLVGQVSAKLESVLAEGAAARREHPEAIKKLDAAISRDGKDQVIERVAYIWFNRFSALRYMDVNDLNPVRVVSPLVGQFQPEILAEAKAGNIDEDGVPARVRDQIRALLDGRTPSQDSQAEAYRLLLVSICNHWHTAMPFLFERIDDFTELLLPEDLLSNSSILAYMRETMTPDACQDVEIIGWLYQFYISEKKDEVFAGLKKNKKIAPENIPAATQLFTPHWIVRYLVENSLGRLWMLNRPNSRLKERMDYYIAPEEPEEDFLRISSPEEIRVCDPACGSGHMLTYAFDLLYEIYEEELYDEAEIPGLILTHNLYGIEIDERAGALAAFALTMKAAARRKRFLRCGVQPNVCVLENVSFRDDELRDYIAEVGRDLFSADLHETLRQFAEAKNFGSLIAPKLKGPAEVARVIAGKDFAGDMLYGQVNKKVLAVLRMAEFLSPNYHVVVANPPYMNAKGMNPRLKEWTAEVYPRSKADFMTMFMERAGTLSLHLGFWSMINIPTWMFLDSFADLRRSLCTMQTFISLIHLGRGIFGSDFGTVAFVVQNQTYAGYTGVYRRLFERHVDVRAQEQIEILFRNASYKRFLTKQSKFLSIPGTPFAYWAKDEIFEAFAKGESIKDHAKAFRGISTGDNERFSRFWHEVSASSFTQRAHSREEASESGCRWFPYNRGGSFRKWYGLGSEVIDYEDGGRRMVEAHQRGESPGFRHDGSQGYFLRTVTWGALTAGTTSFRLLPYGYVLGHKGPGVVPEREIEAILLPFLNSKAAELLLSFVSPTLDTNISHLLSLPLSKTVQRSATANSGTRAVELARDDWDGYETSWDFTALPLLAQEHRGTTFAETYARLRAHWRGMTEEMQRLEEENNRIFIDAYVLQDELTSEVPLEEITLTCNPAYRYGAKKSEAELEALLLADTMREFVSYAVGCMFGRYSLNAPGLVLANQGERVDDHLAKIPNPDFEPDADNVIPVLDGDWFADDIAVRFRKFLRVTFGEEYFQENLAFIEDALAKDIRKYFTRDFFNDHVKRYKKRPIYWLFSSPKGAFNALIYMHRYRPDTASVVLNDYMREFRSKLEAHRRAQQALSISGDATPAQKTKALKEIEATGKQIEELDAWEREALFPLATQKIEIDLDDGVKANYPKLGAALKPIKGLDDVDD